MKEKLSVFVERIKADKRVFSYDESATKQAVILQLLSILGWNTFNPGGQVSTFDICRKHATVSSLL